MSLFGELKRRNVFRAAIAYIIFAWMLLQIVDFVLDVVGSPTWILQTLVILAAAGLPVVMVFAWVFEMTPDGFKRDAEVPPEASFRPKTARRLDAVALFSLSMLVAFIIADRFRNGVPIETVSPPQAETASGAAAELDTDEDARPSIAVLPFRDMSSAQDQAYFGEGIAEELLNGLVKLDGIKVASRTSTFSLADDDLDIPTIAERLDVNNILEGSVRTSGNQVRVTAQLIDVAEDAHLWSETFDGTLDDIFAIQDEITAQILAQLEVHLGETAGASEPKSYTTVQDLSPDAYEKFLRARYLLRRRNEVDIAKATELSEAVIAETPDFPRGLMQLAETLIQGPTRSQVTERVIELTNTALALDPDLAAGHMMLGMIEQDANNPLGAIQNLQKAIALDPSEPRPYHWLGINLANSGYLEEARAQLQNAVDMEPDHANANGYLGYVLLLLGEFDAAAFHFKEQVRHGNEFGSERLVHVEVLKGDLDAARRTLAEIDGISQEDYARVDRFLDAVEDANQVGTYLEQLPPLEDYDWHIVMEHYLLGEIDRAYELQVLWEQSPREAWADFWAEARNHPQFMPLIQANNFEDVWDALGPPPACRKVDSGYDCSPGGQP